MKLTDKQCAVILLRSWVYGGSLPYDYSAEELSDLFELKRKMSEERRSRILTQVDNIVRPFSSRLENLYSKIEGWD